MEDLERKEPWWGNGLRFGCLGCGRCCRGEPGAIWFTEREERVLAQRLSLSPDEFRRRFVTSRYGRLSISERPNGECSLLDGDKGCCTVYAVRPLQCRLFPFWPSLLESPEAWEEESHRCPGMNQGKLHPSWLIERLLKASPFPEL